VIESRYSYQGTAEQQGRRDTKMIGFGLIIFGSIAFLGALLSGRFVNSDTSEYIWMMVFYGAVVLVFAGSIVAGFGIRSRRGAATGMSGGCGSLAVSIGLGLLLFLAVFGFLFVTCFVVVMSDLHKSLK
jgi:hypothetical protein